MSKPIDYKQQSNILNAIRFPLAFMVVFIHCKISENNSIPSWIGITGSDFCESLQVIISSIICSTAVPTFFLISGYLFFYNVSDFNIATYLYKIRKRLYSIFIPYILWISILILKYCIIKFAGFIIYNHPLSSILDFFQQYNGWRMYWDCYTWPIEKSIFNLHFSIDNSAPLLFPLWFLRDLMVVILFTPVIYFSLRRLGVWILLILAGCYITNIWPNIHGFSVIAIFFFSCGAYFSINNKNMVDEFRKYCKISYLLYLITLIYLVFFNTDASPQSSCVYSIFIIISVVTIVNAVSYLIDKGKLHIPHLLQESTFFIYAFHLIYGTSIASLLLNIFFPSNGWVSMLIRYLLMPILTIIVCITLYYILKKCCPQILGVLTGNRI